MIATTRRAVLAGILAMPMVLQAQEFAGKYNPQAQPIGDGIWLVRGADEAIAFDNGGAIANSVIMASAAGAIVVDPGPSLGFGRALSDLAQRVTGQSVAQVLITHLHPDHAFGAGAFPANTLHALPATRDSLLRDGDGFSDAMYRLLAGWMNGTEVVLPAGDLATGALEIGGRKLQLFVMSGHSEADLAILDEASGTLIAGDLVFHNRAPATPNADFAGWQAALAMLEGIAHTQLVPGHGPLDAGSAAIAQTRDWLTWLESALRGSVAEGLDMTEAGEVEIPPRFAVMKGARYELQRSVSHFYPGLEAELFPRVGS